MFQYDGTNTIYFRYDENNILIGFNFNGIEYLYLKNLQGDVVGIITLDGDLIVEYNYDDWGKLLSVTDTSSINLGLLNPMRYRSYYYDNETGYYYLQSRYYNPEFCRFINADEPSMILLNSNYAVGINLFAYCDNNPVNLFDYDGHFGTPLQWAMAVIGGIAGWYFGDYVAKKLGYKSGWKYWTIRAGVVVGGAVIGWFAGTAIVKVATKFLLANPHIMAKLPGPVLWLLGISNPWANAVFQNASTLTSHFNKHAHEWGNKFKNAKQYLNGARNLLKSSGKGIYEFTSKNGWFFKYNSKTNEFICVSNKGTISSFFKPVQKIAYWYEQVRKYK